MGCVMKPCKPVCKMVNKVMKLGSFSFPYKAMECGPDMQCVNTNKQCMQTLRGAAVAATSATKALAKQWNAVKMAKATHAQMAQPAKDAMDVYKVTLRAAEAQSAGSAKMLKRAGTLSLGSTAKVKSLLSQYEAAKALHLKAVAVHDGAKSAATKAYSLYAAALKAHCTAEARQAKAVLSIGHAKMATKNCRTAKSATSE